jgi:hypothetical protein
MPSFSGWHAGTSFPASHATSRVLSRTATTLLPCVSAVRRNASVQHALAGFVHPGADGKRCIGPGGSPGRRKEHVAAHSLEGRGGAGPRRCRGAFPSQTWVCRLRPADIGLSTLAWRHSSARQILSEPAPGGLAGPLQFHRQEVATTTGVTGYTYHYHPYVPCRVQTCLGANVGFAGGKRGTDESRQPRNAPPRRLPAVPVPPMVENIRSALIWSIMMNWTAAIGMGLVLF